VHWKRGLINRFWPCKRGWEAAEISVSRILQGQFVEGVIPVEGNSAHESHTVVSDGSGILSQNAYTCNESMTAAMSAETSAAGSIQRKRNAPGCWSIHNKKRK